MSSLVTGRAESVAVPSRYYTALQLRVAALSQQYEEAPDPDVSTSATLGYVLGNGCDWREIQLYTHAEINYCIQIQGKFINDCELSLREMVFRIHKGLCMCFPVYEMLHLFFVYIEFNISIE